MPEPTPTTGLDDAALLPALRALRDGDFSVRLPEGEASAAGEIAATVNQLMRRSQALCGEVGRIHREIGEEGVFGGQAEVEAAGEWQQLVEGGNRMAANLTDQLRCLSQLLTAV